MKTYKSFKNWIIRTALLLSLNTLMANSYAGATTSNGGAILSHQSNPWFVGKPSVSYCIEYSSNFSLPQQQATLEIQAAVEDLELALKRMNLKSVWQDRAIKEMAKEFILQPTCSQNTDLKILLGTDDAETRQAMGNEVSYVSLANRTEYNPKSAWSKGSIWLVPDLGAKAYKKDSPFWYKGVAVYSIVLHELGHVVGKKHDSRGFMEEFYPYWLVESKIMTRHTYDFQNVAKSELPSFTYYTMADEFFEKDQNICLDIVEPRGLEDFFKEQLGVTLDRSHKMYQFCFSRNLQYERTISVHEGGTELGQFKINFADHGGQGNSSESMTGVYFDEQNKMYIHDFFTFFSYHLSGQLQNTSRTSNSVNIPLQLEIGKQAGGDFGVLLTLIYKNNFKHLIFKMPGYGR